MTGVYPGPIGVDARKLWDGGIGTYIRNLVLAAGARPDAPPFTLFVDPRDRGSVPWNGRVDEIPVRAGKYSLAEHIVLPGAARRAGVALLHAPHYTLPLGWNGPAVVTIHDLAHVRFAHLFPPGAGLYARTLAGIAARRARRVITVSAYARAEIVELLGIPEARVTVTHLAVSPGVRPVAAEAARAFAAERRLPADFVLHIGHRKPLKNLSLVLRALASIPSGSRPPLVISGPPWAPGDPLGSLANGLGLHADVHFAGELRGDVELSSLYSSAALYVQPSLTESFTLPPLEAMACGVPVVAARTGGMPESLGDAAEWLDPADPAAWAAAIQRLLGDAALRQRRVTAGRAQVAKYSWDRTAQETLTVYAEALR